MLVRMRFMGLALAGTLFAAPALGFGPGSNGRLESAGAVCVGGANDGQPCDGSGNVCDDPSDCQILFNPDREVRALVTLIADKDSGGVDASVPIPESTSNSGPDPIEVPDDPTFSTLTVIVEFTKDGQDYMFADIYTDVDFPGWLTPAWESVVGDNDLELSPGQYGEDLSAAIAAALGAPPGSKVSLHRDRKIPVPAGATQYAENEVMGTLTRYKAYIRIVDATAP